ncbi:MAG: hypothetical protein IJ371_05970 [Clostridia bacterium]|nr:hypothetical protein [Clostridia bacterium]
MNEFELEELEKSCVIVDVNKLAKSNIKQIVLPLHRFIEWKGLDGNKNSLNKKELFNCLKLKDRLNAIKLNKIYQTRIWNLLDEDVKKDMNFDDFVD